MSWPPSCAYSVQTHHTCPGPTFVLLFFFAFQRYKNFDELIELFQSVCVLVYKCSLYVFVILPIVCVPIFWSALLFVAPLNWSWCAHFSKYIQYTCRAINNGLKKEIYCWLYHFYLTVCLDFFQFLNWLKWFHMFQSVCVPVCSSYIFYFTHCLCSFLHIPVCILSYLDMDIFLIISSAGFSSVEKGKYL